MEYYVKVHKYHGFIIVYHGTHESYLSLSSARNGFRTIKKARDYMKRLKKKSDERDEITIVSKLEEDRLWMIEILLKWSMIAIE